MKRTEDLSCNRGGSDSQLPTRVTAFAIWLLLIVAAWFAAGSLLGPGPRTPDGRNLEPSQFVESFPEQILDVLPGEVLESDEGAGAFDLDRGLHSKKGSCIIRFSRSDRERVLRQQMREALRATIEAVATSVTVDGEADSLRIRYFRGEMTGTLECKLRVSNGRVHMQYHLFEVNRANPGQTKF